MTLPSGWATASELIRSRPRSRHVPTGLPILDQITGGGIPSGAVVVIGGRPGVGKTSLLLFLGVLMLDECAAAALFYDESRDAGAVRLGQMFGLDRDQLGKGEADVAARFEEMCSPHPLWFPDPSLNSDLRRVAENLHRIASPDRVPLLLVDTIQTAKSVAADQKEGLRERVMQIMADLRWIAKKYEAIVIATSEVSRDSYRRRQKGMNASEISSFSESNAIEYRADLAIFLDGDPDDEIRAVVVKNRFGPKKNFSLWFDREKATFKQLDVTNRSDKPGSKDGEEIEEAENRILKILTERPGITGSKLAELVGNRKQVVVDARKNLESRGRIVGKPGGRNSTRWNLKK